MKTGKRSAASDLNHENWDDEEEHEELGVFKTAEKEQIDQRKILSAKRRTKPPPQPTDTGGLFASFKGFSSNSESTFVPASSTSLITPVVSFPGSLNLSTTTTTGSSSLANESTVSASVAGSKEHRSTMESKFSRGLKKLNETVIEFCQQHVAKNASVDLTSVFSDYSKHLKKLHETCSDDGKSTVVKRTKTVATDADMADNSSKNVDFFAAAKTFTETLNNKSETVNDPVNHEKKISEKSLFSIGASDKGSTKSSNGGGFNFFATSPSANSTTLSTTTTTASFGSGFFSSSVASTAKTTTISGFNFGDTTTTTSGFSFGSALTASSSSSGAAGASADDDGEYIPPQTEKVEHTEEDALFTTKCKLFYSKEGTFVPKGTGMIYVKKTDEGKGALLVRADTTLGNVLLNIMLNTQQKCEKKSKKDISLMCIPNPPIDPKSNENKPSLMLIRVKDEETANELLNIIKQNQ